MNEYELMKSDPLALYRYYIGILLEGQQLTQDQLIKFAYVESIALKET